MASGTITFGAQDAKQGTPASAVIKSGAYQIDGGLATGDYTVLVQWVSPSLREADAAKKAPEKSPIPEKYATAKTSDLKFNVKSGSNQADFELKD